jgi:glycosyltransferase involved in cell wall biosynthesis
MKFGVFVPAYEAASTIERVVRSIDARSGERIVEILVQDDASRDTTYAIMRRLAEELPRVRAVRNPKNLGYGGTKKKAYRYFLERDVDGVALIPGDDQYPAWAVTSLLELLARGATDIALGSRILADPRRCGMPLHRYLANRVLTAAANRTLGLTLTDYHTGARAYATRALRELEFESCGDGHEISMQLLVRAAGLGMRIDEIATPTVYGPESRSVSLRTSVRYGLDVLRMLRTCRQAWR